MANDHLEKFINSNRAKFDDKKPSEKIWKNIERNLPQDKNNGVFWKIAAVVFFCFSAFLTYDNYLKEPVPDHELAELESFYFSQIDYKQSLLNDLKRDNEQSLESLNEELQKLDAMYQVLKEEWKRKPSKEVLEALTLNLIVRIDILNRQLESIDADENDDQYPVEREV